MSEYKGMDVSTWQGAINWQKVKSSGIQFAILRVGFGRNDGFGCVLDNEFARNVKEASAAGVPIGAYFYSGARTAEGAQREAQFVVDALNKYPKAFTYPIAFDLEDQSQQGLGKQRLTDLVLAFCKVLRDAGYYPMLYSNLNWLYNLLDDSKLQGIDHWVAQWNSKCTYKGTVCIWQHSAKGAVSGISGDVDMDISYVNYPQIIKEKGYNGFKKEEEDMPKRYNTIADVKADPTAKEFYLPTLEKLIDKGILKGKGGEGDNMVIDYSEDALRILVMLDRAGKFEDPMRVLVTMDQSGKA